jgi:hypothetical protein
MMSDEALLLHANAHHMSVAYEPLADARERIAAGAQDVGSGEITAIRRLG